MLKFKITTKDPEKAKVIVKALDYHFALSEIVSSLQSKIKYNNDPPKIIKEKELILSEIMSIINSYNINLDELS